MPVRRTVTALAAATLVAGCAVPHSTDEAVADPYEATNRRIHEFNKQVDAAVFGPAAGGYSAVPGPVRQGVLNFSENVLTPGYFVNNLLQGDLEGAGHNFFRFTINSTLGVAGIFAVYLAASRLLNRRTGFIAAFVLATCPQYFFVSRQAMTDMPFVALVNLAMCFFMLAYFGADDDRQVWSYKIRRDGGRPPIEITAAHIFIGVLLLIVVPQFLLFGTFRFMRTAVRLLSLGGGPGPGR